MNPSRRSFLGTLTVFLASSAAGTVLEKIGCGSALAADEGGRFSSAALPLRAVNIMNFIRAEEPRQATDLLLPVREQMELITRHEFPATWLLQYDALVRGPFVKYLKDHLPPNHEVGFWFEINRSLTDQAGLPWKGNPAWGWDSSVPVAYTIGYSTADRQKLADAAMAGFKRVWGDTPKSVASWNLDAWTMQYLSEKYGVEAFGVCRDQVSTDGFTIWGAPIEGYYPCKLNAWSPALQAADQISTPVFRLLGQDPVYAYDQHYRLEPTAAHSDQVLHMIDTMEPVWPAGQSKTFVRNFLRDLARAPCGAFAYAQLGQENSFGWPQMEKGYRLQMEALADLGAGSGLSIETMLSTGRRFRQAFRTTPVQAQIVLDDPFDRNDPAEKTVWYQSRFYRANLHGRGKDLYFRDLFVYSDRFAQPFLDTPTQSHGIEQRMLAVLDGYHWSDENGRQGAGGTRATGRLYLQQKDGTRSAILATGRPTIEERGPLLLVSQSAEQDLTLLITFAETGLSIRADGGPRGSRLLLRLEWVPASSALTDVLPNKLAYRYSGFAYFVEVSDGAAAKTPTGVEIVADDRLLNLRLAQAS